MISKKDKIDSLYKELWGLYDLSYCKLGNKTLEKLKNKEYSVRVLNQIIIGLKWFLNTFDKDTHYIKFEYNKHFHNLLTISVYDNIHTECIDYNYIINKQITKDCHYFN